MNTDEPLFIQSQRYFLAYDGGRKHSTSLETAVWCTNSIHKFVCV